MPQYVLILDAHAMDDVRDENLPHVSRQTSALAETSEALSAAKAPPAHRRLSIGPRLMPDPPPTPGARHRSWDRTAAYSSRRLGSMMEP